MTSIKKILHAYGPWVLVEDTTGDQWRISAETGEVWPVPSAYYRKIAVGEYLDLSQLDRLYVRE